MDPVVAFVGLYRVVGSLFVLRWPFWGALVAVACDLCDLLLFNLFVAYGGWSGFAGYQAFDKWLDQVYLAAFLVVALRDFAPLAKRVAVALYLLRLVGFLAFETGLRHVRRCSSSRTCSSSGSSRSPSRCGSGRRSCGHPCAPPGR